MSNIDINKRIEMRLEALRDLQAEYADLWDSWKVVESKAQPIAALASVFLAGVFTYLGQLPATATAPERWLLLVIAILLIGCAISALGAIKVTNVASPHLGGSDVDEVDDQLREATDDGELAERRERIIQSAIKRWKVACNGVREALKRKQCFLSCCLLMLGAAGLVSLPLVFWTLFVRATTTT